MLEGIIADVLVRVLGSYVDGLNKESIRLGVWNGDLELRDLRLRPDALAVLFETLGLDLPVTVTAGYIGLLRLEVPWKSLRSAPVRIYMHDVTVVASPVSDGDQTALELREKRLKAARLATDEAVRDAKFSLVGHQSAPSATGSTEGRSKDANVGGKPPPSGEAQPQSGYRVARWGWRFTSKVVTKIVDNIQIDVENVVIQYEDASSVRDRPYTATIALDSLRACSTNHLWKPVFIENPSSPVVHKVLYLRGLVLNWEPGNTNNSIRAWILDSEAERIPGQWSGFVRACSRHAIKPMDGELRISLTKSTALAAAIAGKDQAFLELRKIPRVQMDLHFPEVRVILDDFQYHTLLSTIMYLSDIDRKVRPKTAKGRWFWALDRLLPRFKERREAVLRFNATGLRERRLKREEYCCARNIVVSARRKGSAEPKAEAKIVEELESELSYQDVILFRDLADRQLIAAAKEERMNVGSTSRFWSLFSRQSRQSANVITEADPEGDKHRNLSSLDNSFEQNTTDQNVGPSSSLPTGSFPPPRSSVDVSDVTSEKFLQSQHGSFQNASSKSSLDEGEDAAIPNFRMGFLLGRGAIELKEGGYPDAPTPISSLEFGELRLGIETRPGAGMLLEALLGTFQVIDLQKHVKVMYPRAPWAGDTTDSASNSDEIDSLPSHRNSDQFMSDLADDWAQSQRHSENAESLGEESEETNVAGIARLHSYPHAISNAICEIRGEYGLESESLPATSPTFPTVGKYKATFRNKSSDSLSSQSDGGLSGISVQNIEDLSIVSHSPLKYIAALRLNHEEAPEGQWAHGATRMAMDLAIGGMEVLVDGPKGAFVSSVTFWHPREKMPSIMQFLSRAAAPRLASLRMDIQKAILDKSVPMRMDMLIRGPRFVIPGTYGSDISLVLDLGTFAMETSTGIPEAVTSDVLGSNHHPHMKELYDSSLNIRYTDYKMAFSDLGLFVVSKAGKQAAERIIKPFSVHVLLQVLHNSSFLEAITRMYGRVDIAKVKLKAQMPSLQTSVSHDAFRQILDIAKGWGERSPKQLDSSGIEPNPVSKSMTLSAELEEVRLAHDASERALVNEIVESSDSALISFEMSLDFEDLQLELRDSGSKRIVTLASTGTMVKFLKRPEVVDFDFRVRTFAIIDGSRGATAPFRRLAYAGINQYETDPCTSDPGFDEALLPEDQTAFMALSYRGDLTHQEQSLAVKILSLHMVCVRETYFALADFFYLNENKTRTPKSTYRASNVNGTGDVDELASTDRGSIGVDDASSEGVLYSDPFNALGMTTSSAARALREQAERGMEQTKQAIADRGRLNVTADLHGLNLTLVSADGAIGSFDVTNCQVSLTQFSSGAIEASGKLGGFSVRDLTSAYEVYSETIRYARAENYNEHMSKDSDGWSLRIPKTKYEDTWLEARLTNLRIVYLQRFIIILKKYFDALRDSLKPVLEMKGGIGEVFQGEEQEEFPAVPRFTGRLRLSVITEEVDIVMPRHSQSPYEALRFFVPHSSISNEDLPAPGYRIGFQVMAQNINSHVLYQPPAEGEGRALTSGGKEPILRQISPSCPVSDLTPFAEDMCLVAKLDVWRSRRVPQVILNTDGIPVLKDGEEEREYDPAKWLPAMRARVCAPNGIRARLCEAEYSILYFVFTENIIERPDIEFTDIVRGLKTPILPKRKPVQPIMFSSSRMPANYQILFEVPIIENVIMHGADPRDEQAKLIKTELRDLLGCFEYGVDYRMSVEVSANMNSLVDVRPSAATCGESLVMPTIPKPEELKSPRHDADVSEKSTSCTTTEDNRSITFIWDRPFGFRANVMVVASDLRIIVEPELFRDLGNLTAPGFPFLKSSAPAPLLRFNGRLLILTIARPEVWLMANQYSGDARSLVIRGDVIAKVQWAAVTGRNRVDIAANGIHVNLSNLGPHGSAFARSPSSPVFKRSSSSWNTDVETPMLYPCDVSMKFEGSGYDPPKAPGEEPMKAPGSSLSVNAESMLVRIDVNDAPLILAVGSKLVRLRSSELSERPPQPGRFDEWIDKGEEGDARLAIHFALPHSRLMFTDETAGRYVPIMEARLRNAVLRSNFPWLLNSAFEFALDLFNEEKGWWEPGIETFPIEIAASQGRSGSRAINVRVERIIDVNVTPNTVSGAARVSNALKFAIEDLAARMRVEEEHQSEVRSILSRNPVPKISAPESGARRPSVAAFSVRNETGRSLVMWLLHDSTRWTLRGNGDEREVDTPTDEMLWTAVGASGWLSSDPNKNRHLAMRCVLLFNGYEPVTLSTSETGTRLVTLVPDTRELAALASGNRNELIPQTFVWAVSMKHGVPCGCIRSVLRLVNKTNTVLEVNTGGFSKSASVDMQLSSSRRRGAEVINRKATVLLKAGASWSVPVHSVNRSIRIRPAIFYAPENDAGFYDNNEKSSMARGRVRYSYSWSDPLSKLSALHAIGQSLRTEERSGLNGELKRNGPVAPLLTCRAADGRGFFCVSISPKTEAKDESVVDSGNHTGPWVDVHICPPLVVENLMPRTLGFKLASSGSISGSGKDQIVAHGSIEPLREAHVHTAGSDLSAVSLAMGFDNSPQASTTDRFTRLLPHRNFGVFHSNLKNLSNVSMGSGRYTPLRLSMSQEQRVDTRFVRIYCEFWIRNRSDTDLFFRSHGPRRDPYQSGAPKVFLRGCPPGTVAEKFICFSGSWLSFQRTDITEDIWVDIGTEVSEIDKPMEIRFDGLSLFMDVRPAKGRFHRALVATVRNAAWLENRTGAVLQWCQPEALNPHGIALSTKVHSIAPGKHCALHCDFRAHRTALCFRRATSDGLSDWIWSRPVSVEGVEGEFAAKMYRPKRHEQYIARVVVSRLGNGVSSIIVHKEDRNNPPYRIINLCSGRSIAFRQSGMNETHPWLVRPGKSTRYSWDDPQAPVKRRSLVIEVLETARKRDGTSHADDTSRRARDEDCVSADVLDVGQVQGTQVKKLKGAKALKFDLNIDMIREETPLSHSKRFDPPLLISVRVDGPTKVVTFQDGERRIREQKKTSERGGAEGPIECHQTSKHRERTGPAVGAGNVDVELFVKGLGISFVESTPAELAYLSVHGIHFRLDRFDGQQLVICEVMDLQLDNQLSHCSWPVVLWSPPPHAGVIGRMAERAKEGMALSPNPRRELHRKPFFQFTLHGQHPAIEQGIGSFRGIFVALQELQLAADEDFVLRVWLFVVSLLEAAGGSNREKQEALDGKDGAESGHAFALNDSVTLETEEPANTAIDGPNSTLSRLYVEHLELCPLKLSVSFTSSRTSSAAERIGGFRSLIRTLVAVLGNVENAEFRFNALELQHVFDTASHFRSLITEYYVSQGSNQKMVLLASNSLIGNPSALFDSIAIGTRDFFVEPANAKGSADFIASIGRGSSSLLTNTVGGIVGSLGGIPRAVAQGLETAVGDRDYLAERDSIRGGRARIASSPAQGLYTGALSFGHGIASGAAGLIRDPIQGAAEEGPSGFIKGLGKGFIGGMLKPITGALDLIAEPAAGFRSMMVSDRTHGLAEPARPPRAFWGANADQMISYDLRAALGNAILNVVNRGEHPSNEERLLSWTHLVAVHSTATQDEVISFLWALMRRSIRSSDFQTKYLLDAQGNPQKAEKMRAGLVTSKRMIVASLDGHVIWEYPLVHIADTQVSVGAKDFLMVGIRPIGQKSRTTAPTGWQKIHCGSMQSRNELNTALRKALEDLRTTANASVSIPQIIQTSRKGATAPRVWEHRRDGSLEMVDFSHPTDEGPESGSIFEMKSIHHDASVDGRRGVFTDMKLPGRSMINGEGQDFSLKTSDLSQEIDKATNQPSEISRDAVRSIRLVIVNLTEYSFTLLRASLESGRWAQKPPSVIGKQSVSLLEADGTADRAKDISGRVTMQTNLDEGTSKKVVIRFLNPLLASNAYAAEASAGLLARFQGGEKGNHVSTVLTLRNEQRRGGTYASQKQESRTKKTPAEPLLFGRSQVSPFLQPVNSKPPHAPKSPVLDPKDPELIAKLSSLGFSAEESLVALEQCNADLAAAYALLLDRKSAS